MDTDRARCWNGIGFSGMDTDFGNSLAKREKLTAKMEWYAAKLVRKYRKQVGTALGVTKPKAIDELLTTLVWEYQTEEELAPKPVGTIAALAGQNSGELRGFVIRFPYNAALVAAVKALPNRKYVDDANGKRWVTTGTPTDIAAVANLLRNFNFEVSAGAMAFLEPA